MYSIMPSSAACLIIDATPGFDHRVGHLWLLSMTVEPFSISFFDPCMIIARIQHISQPCHRQSGDTCFIVRPGARVVMRRGEPQGRAQGGEDRVGHLWPLGMTAEFSHAPSAGAEVLLPGIEADGVADAMIETQLQKRKMFSWL
jgi:hypothetical protein